VFITIIIKKKSPDRDEVALELLIIVFLLEYNIIIIIIIEVKLPIC
jgi:hypothetical protein